MIALQHRANGRDGAGHRTGLGARARVRRGLQMHAEGCAAPRRDVLLTGGGARLSSDGGRSTTASGRTPASGPATRLRGDRCSRALRSAPGGSAAPKQIRRFIMTGTTHGGRVIMAAAVREARGIAGARACCDLTSQVEPRAGSRFERVKMGYRCSPWPQRILCHLLSMLGNSLRTLSMWCRLGSEIFLEIWCAFRA
jgi:hypothetical protein